MSIVMTLIGLVGIVSVITRSYLLEPVREMITWPRLRYMANCPQCMGVWVGGLYYFITRDFIPANLTTNLTFWTELFLWAGAVSLLSSYAVTIMDYITFAKSSLINSIPGITVVQQTDDEAE